MATRAKPQTAQTPAVRVVARSGGGTVVARKLFLLTLLLSGGCAFLSGRTKPYDDSCLDIAHDCAVCEYTLEASGENLTQPCDDCEKARKCKEGKK